MGQLLPSLQYTSWCPCENSPTFAQVTENIKLWQLAGSLPWAGPSDTLLPTLLITLLTPLRIWFGPNVSFVNRNHQLLRHSKITLCISVWILGLASLLDDYTLGTCFDSRLLFQLLIELVWIVCHLQLYGRVPGRAHDARTEASATSSQSAGEVAKEATSGCQAEGQARTPRHAAPAALLTARTPQQLSPQHITPRAPSQMTQG